MYAVWAQRGWSSAFLCLTEVQRCLSWLPSLFNQAVFWVLTDLCKGQICCSLLYFSMTLSVLMVIATLATTLYLVSTVYRTKYFKSATVQCAFVCLFHFLKNHSQNAHFIALYHTGEGIRFVLKYFSHVYLDFKTGLKEEI